MIEANKIYHYLYSIKNNLVDASRGVLSLFYVRISLIIALGTNLFLWLLGYFVRINFDQDQAVLHYNVDFGINFIGSRNFVFMQPIAGLAIIILNTAILIIFNRFKYIRFLASLLIYSAVLANLILFFSLIAVYLINFT